MATDEGKTHAGIAEFFRAEYGRMKRYVAALIDDEADRDAEDVIQDVMLHMFDAADVTRPVRDLSGYVYRALRNHVIDSLRKRRYQVSIDARCAGGEGWSLADILADVRYDAAADLEKSEIRREISRAIDSLGEEDRMVVIMTELEERSFREISGLTGIPVGTLLSRKSRAMKKIRRELGSLAH